jgi:mono/diheme cytochrome c family protein
LTRSFAVLLQGSLILSSFIFLVNCNNPEKGDNNPNAWKAPSSAKDIKNPLKDDTSAVTKGRALYMIHCWQCHGENGYGDGAAGGALGQQPANFHSGRVRRQADGELFWKLSNGKGNMPPFKDALKEGERWQLITYIRKMANREVRPGPPKALRPDITVEHVMKTDSLAVRILQHPVTKDVYYTTFDGGVIQVKNFNTPNAVSKKILVAKDHGITRLQGAVFVDGQLFLCGNVDDNSKKSTGGRMVRFDVDTSGAKNMTVVFNTVMYGSK